MKRSGGLCLSSTSKECAFLKGHASCFSAVHIWIERGLFFFVCFFKFFYSYLKITGLKRANRLSCWLLSLFWGRSSCFSGSGIVHINCNPHAVLACVNNNTKQRCHNKFEQVKGSFKQEGLGGFFVVVLLSSG